MESLHNRMRDELLEDNMFEDLNHARALIGAWSHRYNEDAPHQRAGLALTQPIRAPMGTTTTNNNQQPSKHPVHKTRPGQYRRWVL